MAKIVPAGEPTLLSNAKWIDIDLPKDFAERPSFKNVQKFAPEGQQIVMIIWDDAREIFKHIAEDGE